MLQSTRNGEGIFVCDFVEWVWKKIGDGARNKCF